MRCRESRRLIPQEAHGEIPPATRVKLAAHLASCPGCRALREETMRLLGWVRSELLHVPRIDVASRVMARVHQAAPSLARVDGLGRRQVLLSLGAGTAIATGLAGVALIRVPSLLREGPLIDLAVWVPRLLVEAGQRILKLIHLLVDVMASSLRVLNILGERLEFLAPVSITFLALLAATALGTTAVLIHRDLVRHRPGAPWQGGKW